MTANIIHKDDRPERIEPLMKQLSEQGINHFRLWDGIHARTVVEGVNLAHKQIIQNAKDYGLEKVLVFEDDIEFFGKGAFDYYLKHEPDEYDIYLGGIYLGKIVNGVAMYFTAMHCYMVHSRFYNTFLSVPNDMHIDHALAGLGLYVVCDPFICRQSNGHSSNTGKYENYDILFNNRNIYKNS